MLQKTTVYNFTEKYNQEVTDKHNSEVTDKNSL